AKNTDYPKLVIHTYSRLGQENVRLGQKEKALEFVLAGEKIAVEENLWFETANMYGQLGELYNLGFNKTEIALQYLLKSDSIYQAHDVQGNKRGSVLSYIGDVYSAFGDTQEARAYQEQALDIFKKSNFTSKQKFILVKLASIEALDKNYEKAISYMLDCIAYYGEKKFLINEAHCQVLLSDFYYESGQMEKALNAGQIAIDLNKKNNPDYGLFMALVNQTKILHEHGNYTKSNELALEAESLGLKLNDFSELKSVYEKLYLNSEILGDFEKAYTYSKEHKRVSDTLVAIQNIENAKELEAQYKNSQQQQEIALLQSQNQLAIAQRKNQRNLLFGIISFASIALLVLFTLYRNRKKTATKLIELSAAKSTFFQNISHEFRTPLSLISGPIERRLENKDIDESDRKEFEMIYRNSNRLMDLINQILDISKIESKEINVKVSSGNLNALLKSIAASFNYKANKKQIDFNVDVEGMDDSWFDKDAIEKITINLLSNAFKFTPEKGLVSLKAWQQNGMAIIEVENSGSQFSKTEINTIFDRFSRLENKNEEVGSGIGLALVKELTQLSRGEIKAENSKKDVVKFSVMLPIEKTKFEPHEIVISQPSIDINNQDSEIISTEIDDIPLMLVVDDNDDIRSFINESFKNEYRIIEAIDGKKGIEVALEYIPDIIISDVMMPNVSGIELCTQLKQDQRTSHIPIVLLTAKVDQESQFQGLETGADDYVLKPFSVKLLATRVKNLVKSRIQLQDRYSKEVILKPHEIAFNSIDEQFIEKVKEVLDENMTDDSFSIKDFSGKLSMSRMQLHRKLKALTGLSASEFLRTERLKLAVSLFEDVSLNINEICYQSGFNSPS
ncbi:MAG: response regulator, partial [Flavobacteriaceae bacterium]|nr:response regulator [Flavobacteriaceae bacterium]